MERELYLCCFEMVDKGERVVAFPVGLEGGTEGYGLEDAVAMAADWLRETATDYLINGEPWPELPITAEPRRGGRMVTVAVGVSLDDVDAVTASEAAKMLGISTSRVAQLCRDGLLESWKDGRARMVSVESIETRLAAPVKAGRPRTDTPRGESVLA